MCVYYSQKRLLPWHVNRVQRRRDARAAGAAKVAAGSTAAGASHGVREQHVGGGWLCSIAGEMAHSKAAEGRVRKEVRRAGAPAAAGSGLAAAGLALRGIKES